MVNNAGIMPLAFLADHDSALAAWERCIDINFKGVLHGTIAAYDHMVRQGRGHLINISSIYGNHPVIGAAVYGATKAAVNFFSESVRVESRGKIKVTVIKPTGVPGTGLSAGVVNEAAAIGILGQNTQDYMALWQRLQTGDLDAAKLDANDIGYPILAPDHVADAILHAIDQPWGVSLGDVTIRAAGDMFIL